MGIRLLAQLLSRIYQGSFLIDYTVNRHFDIYGGVTFADQTGGFNSGQLADNLGIRLWRPPQVVSQSEYRRPSLGA